MNFSLLVSEKANPNTQAIDESGTKEILTMINNEDKSVALAVEKEIPNIEKAVDAIYKALSAGGRLFYVGAGTSGRLGVLDASECPPTFKTPPSMVQAYIAGGDIALRTAVEGAEDDSDAGYALIDELGFTAGDILVGITASGTAPYVIGAVQCANEKGAVTIALVTNPNTQLAQHCKITIAPVVGPEVIAGSTRMKSGTAQKLVLNMLTTTTMVKLGKVYKNLMVDMKASNKKLYDRSIRIIGAITGAEPAAAIKALEESGKNLKVAIVIIELGCTRQQAEELLKKTGGRLREALRKTAQET